MLYCTVTSKIITIMFPWIIKCYSTRRLKWNVWSEPFTARNKPTHNPEVIHWSYLLINSLQWVSVFIRICVPSVMASKILTHVITHRISCLWLSFLLTPQKISSNAGVSGVLLLVRLASCSHISTHSQLCGSNTICADTVGYRAVY